MASANARVSGLGALDFAKRRARLMDRVEDVMETALEKGETAMKEAVATRGTGRTWSRPWGDRTGSFPGRIDTGHMQKEIRGEITEKTRNKVEGNLGWDDDSE